jgi:hypothetical protein
MLWIREIHYNVHKRPTLVSVPNQMDPVCTLTFNLFYDQFNVILCLNGQSDIFALRLLAKISHQMECVT